MSRRSTLLRSAGAVLFLAATACVKRQPVSVPKAPPQLTPQGAGIVQGTLTSPGSPPFYLRATITERGDPTSRTEVEISWMAPDKWRRVIKSQTEFSQTLIVNGNRSFEQDSDEYFPLWSQTLVGAMVDPTPVLNAYRPGEMLLTKANGASDESGKVCFPDNPKMCMSGAFGLRETVGSAGHNVDFMNYQEFHGKRIARLLMYHVDPGDSYKAQVTELTDLKDPDPDLFSVPQSVTSQTQIRSVMLSEAEMRALALQPLEIIWPQVLDGKTSGETAYYVSTDRSGRVREVLPLTVAIERGDDTARRQIMKWMFKPMVRGGVPVQAEAMLKFDFNTRAYGPANPLTDEEVRKLVSNLVEPVFPQGTSSGTTYIVSIAVDSDGNIIEEIPTEGPHELFQPCSQALAKWHFNPIMEGGRALPYRAQIVFKAP